MERPLTAILAADVVGYARLVGEDEAGTLAALRSHRQELIDPKAAEYNGRIVKLMGDGTLMEFPTLSMRWHSPSTFSTRLVSETPACPKTV